MNVARRARVTPATVIASIALLVSLNGTSVAAVSKLSKNSVGTAQLASSPMRPTSINTGPSPARSDCNKMGA